ncbi:hypothetical protein [Streptomyces sp. AK010]|uniref:hypothetical protein n=1 Tax=Streptomyces sp. AK010 TaxID=2723074 RepID=UPI0017988FA2|nr:hypothetical protein [Streptomyces sp. AK010]MBB6416357.1 hypothetical protein [Streptomyces sp. AK010]
MLAHLVHRGAHPPFAAHAWVEAERQLVGEGHPKGHFKTLISIPPLAEDRNR